MPTYQYACTECGHAFEQFQSFTDDALTVCPECEGRLRKVFNAVGVVFKGSGFYRNDSRTARRRRLRGSNGSGERRDSSSTSSRPSRDSSGHRREKKSRAASSAGDDKNSGDLERRAAGSSAAEPAPPGPVDGRDAGRRNFLAWADAPCSPAPAAALRRAVLARRRPLAALCAAVAVAAAAAGRLRAPSAAHDGADRRPRPARRCRWSGPATWPAHRSTPSVPAGVLPAAAAVGRTTAGPVRAGEADDRRAAGRRASLLRGLPRAGRGARCGSATRARCGCCGSATGSTCWPPTRRASRRAGRRPRRARCWRSRAPGAESPGLTNGALVVVGHARDGGAQTVRPGVGLVVPLGGADPLACCRRIRLSSTPHGGESHMLKGFKDFIMRGNLVELAVAFVIGGAFATVVTATVGLIMDFIGKIGGTPDFSAYKPGGRPGRASGSPRSSRS